MSLYPSLEDMMVDQMMKAQQSSAPSPAQSLPQGGGWIQPQPLSHPPTPASMAPVPASVAASYPGLAEYMGLELSEALIRENMPEYLPGNQVSHSIQCCNQNHTHLCLCYSIIN